MRTIIEQNLLLYAMAAVGMLGILSQIFLNRCYKLLIREASDTQMEKKEFMKKLRFRFRTDRKRSGDKMNMGVFLQRNLMDYRYHKLSLHQWKRLSVGLFLVSLCLGAAGVVFSMRTGIAKVHIQHLYEMAALVTGTTLAAALWLDARYKKSYLMTVLEDYFCHFGVALDYTDVDFEAAVSEEQSECAAKNETVSGKPSVTVAANTAEKPRKKAPAIVGIRRKNAVPAETKAQREKRELQENLARINAGERESAAELEQTRERNREILRQMDSQEQERIIRDVLAEFLA